MNRVASAAQRLQNSLNVQIAINADGSQAIREASRIRTSIATAIGAIQVDIRFHASADTESQLRRIRAGLASSIGAIPADIQLRLSSDATTQIQRLRSNIRSQISAVQLDIQLRISANATNQIQQVRSMINSQIGTVNVNINLRLSQASLANIRSRILAELGTIQADIQLRLPPALTDMVQNLRRLVLQLLRAVRQLNSNFPIGSAQQLQNALQRIAQLEAQINQLQQQLNNRIREGDREANGMLSTLKQIAATYLSIVAAQKLASATLGAAMEQQQYQDTFIARAGNEALGNAIYDQVSKQALQFGQKVDQAMSAANSFMSMSMDPKQLTDLNKLAMRLSKLNPKEGLEGAAFSMKELMSGDYVSIVERFNMGRTMVKDSDALKSGKAGDVSGFIKGMDKLLNQQNMTEKAFEKMLDSPAAKWEKLIGNIKFKLAEAGKGALAAFAPLIDRMNAFFDGDGASTFFSALQRGLYVVTAVVGMLFDAIQAIYTAVVANWSTIEPILIAISAVYLIRMIAMIAQMTARVYQLGIAWLAANMPIVLVVLGVWLLIGVLDHLGVTADQVVGFVAGTFSALFAMLWNGVAFVWNIFSAFAEFLINLFIDPKYAIEKLMYDLVMNFLQWIYSMTRGVEDFASGFTKVVLGAINAVIGGINKLVDAMNNLPGFNIKKIEPFDTNNVNFVSDQIKRVMNMIKAPTSDKGVVHTARMESKDIKSSFDFGYQAGADLVNKLKMPELPKIDPNAKYDIPKIDKINSVDEVGKVKDKVDISSEDLKVMRELAEIQAIQNFVTLTPTVQVQTGDINNGYDIDTIIRRIEQSLEEQIATSAQGVYG